MDFFLTMIFCFVQVVSNADLVFIDVVASWDWTHPVEICNRCLQAGPGVEPAGEERARAAARRVAGGSPGDRRADGSHLDPAGDGGRGRRSLEVSC